METLFSLSFDNISSKDPTKIAKGVKQIEGLLAQFCIADSTADKNDTAAKTVCQRLDQVAADPAFQEFFKLQEGFQWNVATRLVDSLERLLGMPSNALNDTLIQSMLALLQGILLLHPPSRTVFQNDSHMNVLLDLLDVAIIPEIQSQALLVLVSALLATPTNTRTFEKQDGLLTVASLFKSRSTAKQVKMKAVEFFYFYLMPESSTAGSQKAEDRKGQARTEDAHRPMAASVLRTTSEKQQMLGKYLNNVAELVQDLQEATPMPIAV